MSDYGDQYVYDEPEEQMAEENIETTLQFENFNAEQLFRNKKYPQALDAFQTIYQKACDHNIHSWKNKVLTRLLQIYVHLGNGQEARKTLHAIRQMNEVNKTNEQAVKSIIKALISVERKMYESFWEDIFALIKSLDDLSSQLKCYFLMIQKQIQTQNREKSKLLYDMINETSRKMTEIPSSLELEMLYNQILYLKLQKESYKHILKSIYIKLSDYENDTNTNQAFLSKIKQQIAESLYKEENYVECANFLCECFIQNSTSGSSPQKNKQLLKINTLVIFLCGNLELLQKKEYNPMLQPSTAIFKTDADIQSLYGLISAFKEQNIAQFEQILKVVNMNLHANSPYADLQKRVLFELRKQKVYSICKCYKNITFQYIQRRINEPNINAIESMLFSLIASDRINGVIHLQDKYLEILPEENKYYTVQLQNLKDMTEKM